MESPSSRIALLRWLAPSADPAARRLVVAGVAGILLTAPLSFQLFVAGAPPFALLFTAVGAALALRCCGWAWNPSSAVTWASTLVCVVFATATVTEGVGQVASAVRASEAQLVCVDDVSPAVAVGGQMVLNGQNPYAAYDVLRAERSLGCPSLHVTPLRSGAFAARAAEPPDHELAAVAGNTSSDAASNNIMLGFSYPAGSALVGIAGAHGVAVLDVLLLLTAGIVVVWTSPARLRRWVALALLAQAGALVFIGPGHPDGIVAALLIVACARREPVVGGVALGLACAIKQTAWFVAPVLLILAFRQGPRQGLRHAGSAALVFAIVNVPFVVVDPSAWLRGVLSPQVNPLFPHGDGLVHLFIGADSVILVLGIFTAIMVATVVAGCLIAWRGRGGWAAAGVIVASLGLWDGTRSLLYYVGLLGLIAVSICARDLLPRRESSTEDSVVVHPLLHAQPVV